MTETRYPLYFLVAALYIAGIVAVLWVRHKKIPTAQHAIAFLPWLIGGLSYVLILIGLVVQNGFHDIAPSHVLAWWGMVTRALGPANLIVCVLYLWRRWKG